MHRINKKTVFLENLFIFATEINEYIDERIFGIIK